MRSRLRHDDLPGIKPTALDGVGTTMHLPSGTRLCRHGELGRQAFIIIDGTVAVAAHASLLLAVLGPGDVVGEGAVLSHGLRTADVECVTDVTVRVFTPTEFSTLRDRDPDFATRVDQLVEARAA